MPYLLDDFKLVVLSRTDEKHELNKENCNFTHGDGWGIIIGRSGRIEELYKKDIACWKDPRFLEYYNIDADFVVLHARRASRGSPINCSYTHPFEREGWYFCHNGTITEPPAEEKRDSEQFLVSLVSSIKDHNHVKDAIENTVSRIKEYTALNFILASNNKAFILVKYRKWPKYYTMKYLEKRDYVIVSSEVLPQFNGKWERMTNGTILELDTQKVKLRIL